MSLLDNMSRGSPGASRHSSFSISERGREYLNDRGLTGDPKTRVLVALETCGSSADIDDLRRTSGLSGTQIERILPHLVRSGLVQDLAGQPVGGEF